MYSNNAQQFEFQQTPAVNVKPTVQYPLLLERQQLPMHDAEVLQQRDRGIRQQQRRSRRHQQRRTVPAPLLCTPAEQPGRQEQAQPGHRQADPVGLVQRPGARRVEQRHELSRLQGAGQKVPK